MADQPRLLDLPRWASACDFMCPGERNRRPSHDLARPGWLDGVTQALLGSILDANTLCFSRFRCTDTFVGYLARNR